MVSMVNYTVWRVLEDAITPLPKDSSRSRILHHLPAALIAPAALITGVAATIVNTVAFPFRWCCGKKTDPKQDFRAVCDDSRLWERLGDIEGQITLGQENPDFLLGTATCTLQDSGAVHCPNSQWADWELECIQDRSNRSGTSANLFGLYQTPEGRAEIADRLHKLGVNSYRFSIEWSHIEPQPGEYDLDMLEIYIGLCRHLRDEGITPIVSLHHFSEPKWFHALGSFENEENIEAFVQFAEKIFPYLAEDYKGAPLVTHFCTINEPAIEAFSRYIRGAFSPGVKFSFTRAGHFIKGALKAHNAVYERLKAIHSGVHLGIVHQRLKFKASNPFTFLVTRYLSRLVNDVVLNCFRTGWFECKLPFTCNLKERLEIKTDFVGLQYYVRPLIGFAGSTSYHEPMTVMPFREDPEGLYEAILEVHEASKKPILITENGISTHDEEQRERYLTRALYATQRAAQNIGLQNLWGYIHWCFTDNFEWDMGMRPQSFGAYFFYGGKPKRGMNSFIRICNAWRRAHAGDQAA